MANPYQNSLQRSTVLKWPVFLAFVWSQVAFAAHQFEHTIDEAHETCTVCLQFDRDDDVTIDSDVACESLQASFELENAPAGALYARGFAHYQSRDSP